MEIRKRTESERASFQQPTSNVQPPRSATNLQKIFSFTTILALGFILGRVSGLVREMVVSASFGLSADLDAYFLAYTVPTIINNIVAGGSITVAVLPVFSRYLARGERAEFWFVASIVTNFVLLVTGGLTLVGMLLAQPIIALIGAGVAPTTQTLATAMLVVMMPTLLLNGALNMLLAMLNALDRFWAPALIFLALNLGIIVAVILLAPFIGVHAVAWGFLIGVAAQVALQFFAVCAEQPRYHFRIDLHHPAVREVARAFVPVTALSLVAQINYTVDRAMAGTLAPGSISALAYADTIVATFYMLGISLGVAVFPSLSRMVATNDHANTAHTVVASLRMLIFILAPLTLLLIPFADPIIGLIFGRGKFDAHAVALTAPALAMYALGLIATAALYVLQRVLYALRDNLTPLIVGACAAAAHIALNWVLMRDFAHAGIALSTSLTAIASALALIAILARAVRGLEVKALTIFLLRCAALAVISATLAAWVYSLMPQNPDALSARITGVACAGLGGAIYFLLALVTRTRESQLLAQFALNLFKRN